ncbi:MAG: hypothetical protein ABSC94_11145 [Polyangiaceae bacterium]|jgi:peptide/nickel transport system substrate-binding protein
MMTRRAILGAAGALLASTASINVSSARGRPLYGSRIAVHVPWPLGRVDPHRVDDVAAACFGEALFDTLYARDSAGALVPSLAEAEPEPRKGGLRVALRSGLRFASGAICDARAAAVSIERARASDAAAWLTDVAPARVDAGALLFAGHDPRRLVRALASPAVAIVPPHFAPERPDGTGPFRAEPKPWGLRLARNTLAAAGPSFLDVIDLQRAADLATSLRAFESGVDDLGWLGSFLHEPRTAAQDFDGGAVAWAILRTGRDAGPLDVPGMAQTLADGVSYASLEALVVGPAWTSGSARWTGPPCDLLVREDAPWLGEVARAMCAALSAPLHEVTPRAVPAADFALRRSTRSFVLMLDVARPIGPGDFGTLLGLAAADGEATASAIARHPPLGGVTPRTATRTMRIGVAADVRLQGGRASDLVLPPSPWGRGIDWGGVSRVRGVDRN